MGQWACAKVWGPNSPHLLLSLPALSSWPVCWGLAPFSTSTRTHLCGLAPPQAAGAGETQEALYGFWLERVRTNLHVILCLSPVGEAFRERCRMFPGLVNCTTIDW